MQCDSLWDWDTSMSIVVDDEAKDATFKTTSFIEISANSVCDRSFFGLSDNVRKLFVKYKSIEELYDWQKNCLNLACKNGKNLVYSLPTSGGKTLVAEILMLRELILRGKNVIFILPYVALAQEKVRSLSPFGLDLKFYVEEYAGSKGRYPPLKHRKKCSVYVCTIEKAYGLVECLLEAGRLTEEIGMVVVDELHLLGEEKRGPILEMMLSELMFIAGNIRIIGMSATIGNADEVASFLNANLYQQDFRPTELTEYVKCGKCIYKIQRSPLFFSEDRVVNIADPKLDPYGLAALVGEVVPLESCLVFCQTKKLCSKLAWNICSTSNKDLKNYKVAEKLALLRALSEEGDGSMCHFLRRSIPYGVAYHNSDLTNAERKLLEEAFLSGTICCICCTSTLAAGINLPAKRVIIFPYVGMDFLKLGMYRQMSGRAGRTGFASKGESIIILEPNDKNKLETLMQSSMDKCTSQMTPQNVARLVIGAVGFGVATDTISLEGLLKKTLSCAQSKDDNTRQVVRENVKNLIEEGVLLLKDDKLELTTLAQAAVKGNLDVSEAKIILEELKECVGKGLILESSVHLFYVITPYGMPSSELKLDHDVILQLYDNLTREERNVAIRVGITEGMVQKFAATGYVAKQYQRNWGKFFLSLIVNDLWMKSNVWKTSEKFGVERGAVLAFMMKVSTYGASIQRFTEALKLEHLTYFPIFLQNIVPRLSHCCSPELLQLMQLPAVKIGRANQLYKAGFKTLKDISNANPQLLVSSIDHMPRRVAFEIVAAAKLLLLEKMETLREEADEIMGCLESCSADIEENDESNLSKIYKNHYEDFKKLFYP